MECRYFGQCGSCRLFPGDYEAQLEYKIAKWAPHFPIPPAIFPSPSSHFRARGEFRIFHNATIHYAMHQVGGGFVAIEGCSILIEPLTRIMEPLLEAIAKEDLLARKLFRIDFLSGLRGEILATLIYHRPIDTAWKEAAQEVAQQLGIMLMGRSRGRKIVLERDFIYEELPIAGHTYRYIHTEGSFTQPNPFVNVKMIEWALNVSQDLGGKLLELYCGSGNFTLPLARNFEAVLATEIAKSSIQAAKEAAKLNGVENVTFARLSSQEMAQALGRKRQFKRLDGVDLDGFSTLFVDPPRCGLDPATLQVATHFNQIIYISCNPETLLRDLEVLQEAGFKAEELAFFDQFPYTEHLEVGVFLRR
ncbi:MAG: tRNA (uridine(54)-C5)-methyltransferase TrmA [Nitratiruptor sp.]|nr:tRNA (uridine(54)-C5)-methyltransferase TrmA [Nitratiruptor sp.]NPA83895.1 tRNA (uridine(54)-C5)-methyltransferase TrmA [Campylobacterota bacterium]